MSEDLVLFRDDAGRPGRIGLHCAHRGADLSYGRIEDGGLRCIYHGWLYDRQGRCLEQPGEPAASTVHERIRLVGENPSDFGDSGQHGTHVAGIIAAHGQPPVGIRGLAPAVTLRSYRVFGKNSQGASNYSILKAIDRAVADGCDLINMSLGGAAGDEATLTAIEEARAQGAVVIAAAGNDGRGPVGFPAAHSQAVAVSALGRKGTFQPRRSARPRGSQAVAVSALGRKGTFPSGSTEAGEVAAPYGQDRMKFIAAFSNAGPEIDLVGPGLGIISTVPGGYAPMSGTSMACPAVTGIAARVLAKQPSLLAMPRDQARSDAIAHALFRAATSFGFAARFEGHGLPR